MEKEMGKGSAKGKHQRARCDDFGSGAFIEGGRGVEGGAGRGGGEKGGVETHRRRGNRAWYYSRRNNYLNGIGG